MRSTLLAVTIALVCGAYAQQLSLSEARAKIGEVIDNPVAMQMTTGQLSAEDQRKFLAEVNAAIAKMPGSSEARAASFLDVNRAALKAAQKVGLAEMLAEVFATVPLDALTILNENFASDLFNRSANVGVTYTDEQYTKLAQDTLAKVAARNAEVDDGAVRVGFAILMFVRASNGTPAGLADKLAEVLPKDYQEVAKQEWFPAALAEGESKSYDPMVGEADVGLLPNEQVVMRIAHAQSMELLLADLAAGGTITHNLDTLRGSPYGTDRGGIGSGLDNGLYRVPFFYNRKVIGTKAGTLGSGRKIGGGFKVAREPTPLVLPSGAMVPTGSKAGDKPVTVITPSGQTVVVRPGEVIPTGSTVVGGGTVIVPPGTPIAPGGMPVGPGGKPQGPGGQTIEPGGYDNQH